MDHSSEMIERVRSQLAASEKRLWALAAFVSDASITRLMNCFVVTNQILLVPLSLAANLTDEWLVERPIRMSINDVTLQALLQHDDIAGRALDVHLDCCVN